jgi:hypothetical protein
MRSNASSASGSANVVAFPLKPQSAERLRARGLSEVQSPKLQRPVVYDGAWYHDEAIAADRPVRKDH